VILGVQAIEPLAGVEQRDPAAGNDALFDRRPRGMHRIIDAILALLHFDFGRAADADDGNPARQFRQALLQFLLVVIRGRLVDLRTQLSAATLDLRLLAGAVDNRRAVLVDADLLGRAEHVERDALELDAKILADYLTAAQDGKVIEHCLAAIAEARRLHSRDLQPAAQFVDAEGRLRLPLDILRDDPHR